MVGGGGGVGVGGGFVVGVVDLHHCDEVDAFEINSRRFPHMGVEHHGKVYGEGPHAERR